jgi:hypothetical protein
MIWAPFTHQAQLLSQKLVGCPLHSAGIFVPFSIRGAACLPLWMLCSRSVHRSRFYLFIYLLLHYLFKKFLLFICAYDLWVISPPFPRFPSPYPLPLLPTLWLPSRNYFALIFNFVEERV